MSKAVKIKFKAGDTFGLVLYVTNKTVLAAVAIQTVLNGLNIELDALLAFSDQDANAIAIKRGQIATQEFNYALAIKVDISTWIIASSIKWLGKPLTTFTVTILDGPGGKFKLTKDAAVTQTWKSRIYDVDVQFTIDGEKKSADTFNIEVVKDVTVV